MKDSSLLLAEQMVKQARRTVQELVTTVVVVRILFLFLLPANWTSRLCFKRVSLAARRTLNWRAGHAELS